MTTSTERPTAPLALIFTVNDGLITRALDGMIEDELWRRPSEQTNPMFWLLGHIVHTRGGLVRLLGDDYRTGWGDRFQRGASIRERHEYPALAEIERVRTELGERLAVKLASITDEHLARAASGPPLPGAKTVADQIAFLGLHEAYHVGQLAYVRKMLGHTGIIG